MKKGILIFIISFLLSSIIYHLGSSISYAQQVSLSITPPLLELVIKPGKSVMVAYRVENSGDPVILTAKLKNFEPKDNYGNIKIKDDLSGPVRFSLDNADTDLDRPFFLKTGQSQQLLLRIRIPEGAPNGDYYYTLLAEATPPTNQEGIASTRARTAIGSNILITITDSGAIDIKPKVVLFSTGRQIFDSFDKIPLTFVLANKGKNMIKPEGKITLKGNFGEQLGYDIVPKNILSESERLVEATPSASLSIPDSPPISLSLSGLFIGLYHLSTSVTFGENSPTVFASTTFFAFPFKLVGGLILVIIISIFMIKRFSKNEDHED